MSKVLLVGNGAREHAIAKALSKSGVQILAYMDRKNPGIAKLAEEIIIGDTTNAWDMRTLKDIDYAVIGPELPLARATVDTLEKAGIPCIGPKQHAAKIETSKSFARRTLERAAPEANPRFVIARSLVEYRDFIKKIRLENLVVKPDGLTGGKGVRIYGEHLHTDKEAEDYVKEQLTQHGIVILEERLIGTEFTVQVFALGPTIQMMPLVRDYKRAYDNDEGPNTGSMGSYSQEDHGLPYVTLKDLDTALNIIRRTLEDVDKITYGTYRGILYGQFMKTEQGIKVVEFNARFGDPEAMNVLSLLETPLDEIFRGMIDGELVKPKFRNEATVCVYIVPEGYPGPDVIRDSPIKISDDVSSEIYYASVYEDDNQVKTTGSRAIGVLGIGPTLQEARDIAYSDASKILGKVRYRSDIAKNV